MHLVGKNESRQPVILRVLVPVSAQRRAPICGTSYCIRGTAAAAFRGFSRGLRAVASYTRNTMAFAASVPSHWPSTAHPPGWARVAARAAALTPLPSAL